MKLRLSYLLMLCLMTCIMQAQSKKAYLKAAEESLLEQDYYSASVYFDEVLQFDTTDLDIRYKVAESARKFNSYTTAARHYSYLMDIDTMGTYPKTSYYLAEMWTMLGNYDVAQDLYKIYLAENSGVDTLLDFRAIAAIDNIDYAKDRVANPDESILIDRLPTGINTPYSEFAARDLGESLFYSSHQYEIKDQTWGKLLIGKLMESVDSANGQIIAPEGSFEGQSIANATFSKTDSMIVFSVCNYINADELRCDLYSSQFATDTTLQAPVKLPTSINTDTTTSTQAYLIDEDDGSKVMYFVSDRAGGLGGLDIWYSRYQGSEGWQEPINAAKINTASNDISPSYDPSSGKMYWSSDGRRGLGGYDVYSAYRELGEIYSGVDHLDAPINSSYNDIYYQVVDGGDKAYFSSNRKGSMYIAPAQEACCYDIYEATLEVIRLEFNAMTYDLLSRDSIIGATVELIDAKTGRQLEVVTNELGKDHYFDVVRGREYLVISSHPDFYTDTLQLNTTGMDGEIEQYIYLDSDRYALDVSTFSKRDDTPLLGTTVKLIDLSDNSIADIVQINEASNDYIFVMEPGKNYRIEGSKDGYITTSADISTIGDLPDKRIKIDLYLDSYDLNIHLPVSLYFDNDMPDPGSRKTSTTAVYSDLYYQYVDEVNNFQRRNPSEEVQLADFFETKVKGGYVQMQRFYDELHKAMQQGVAINLTIKGHTSPLAVNKYNLVLGQRRVISVRNDMASYRGGILLQYLDNGQIKITDISFGEETSATTASDSAVNKQQSIYSVDASLERRVEIIKATKQ